MPGDEARKNMRTLVKHNNEPRVPITGTTNTLVIDVKGKNPAFDSKISMGSGGKESEEFEFVLFIFLLNCLVMFSKFVYLCVYLR